MYIYISHVNVTQTVPDISPLMPMHQDPLLVSFVLVNVFTQPRDSNMYFFLPLVTVIVDGSYFSDTWIDTNIFIQENVFEKVC